MSSRPVAPAELPPAGIIGLEPSWSRLVLAPGIDETGRTWHILDSWASRSADAEPELTLLCVHGNPSWSFLWRGLIAEIERKAPQRVRTIAVDQLDMGFSERTGRKRTLATRVDDLCQLTKALGITGPVITVAHDWGGPVSLGWALRHLPPEPAGGLSAQPHISEPPTTESLSSESPVADCPTLAGVVLTNTAVHQPAGSPAPALIRLIRSAPVLRPATVLTRAFIRGALAMSRPRLQAAVKAGFVAPYLTAARRTAIADFVADIPLEPEHESTATLDAIAAGLADLAGIPALLLWGPRDQVFSDLYLHDLERRMPHADVHRFPGAAHFVAEDADVGAAVCDWIQRLLPDFSVGSGLISGSQMEPGDSAGDGDQPPIADSPALTDFSAADPMAAAVVEPGPVGRSISFSDFAGQVDQLAAGMTAFGINPGERVALMIPPGIDLALTVYACWRFGAVVVLVDSGLGAKGMHQALKSAHPAYLIGIDRALAVARVLRWPGRRIAICPGSGLRQTVLNAETDLAGLAALGGGQPVMPTVPPEALAALVFTSGSTGPSKGVLYRHRQIKAQRDALRTLYSIAPGDRLVAAFAPFALYGPTLGITSMVPAMEVAAPGTLTAGALVEALQAIDATLVFASPAALVNVVATAPELADSGGAVDARATADITAAADFRTAVGGVRLVLSAGAPVSTALLRSVAKVFSAADLRTPYGMTELLPVADVSLQALSERAEGCADDGVCVGYPLPSVEVMIDPLGADGQPTGAPQAMASVLGEILVRAPHACEGYDRLWWTDYRASQPRGWHRSGDIGQLDSDGCLIVSGRLAHVISTASGPVGPVGCEQQIEKLAEVALAAVVGVGPVGTQVAVAVLRLVSANASTVSAPMTLADRVRGQVRTTPGVDLAAVLITLKLPVDRRHNSKIDRAAVARWAERVLAGDRATVL